MRQMHFGTNSPVVVNNDLTRLRAGVTPDGADGNTFTQYNSEVKFENIPVKVNITRVKVDDRFTEGVCKGAIFESVPLTVPTNTAGSTMHAMKKRCDAPPNTGSDEGFIRGHKLLMEKFEAQPTIVVDGETFERYLSLQHSDKIDAIKDCFDSGEMHFAGDAKQVFAKQEALLKDHGAQPRVVYQASNSRDPTREQMHNATTGAVVMVLQERMAKVFSLENPLNKGNKVIFAPGRSGSEIAYIINESPGVALESDMKNNDATQAGRWRKYEAMCYKKLGAPDWFVREFARNTKIKVWTRYGVSAEIEGQRWSGESTTTPGNTYVGMVQILNALELAGVVNSTNVHGGDDYLGVVETQDVKAVAEVLESEVAKTGMKAETVLPPTRQHATFYRKRHVRSDAGDHPVPQFGRVLAKLNVRANRNARVSDRDLMAGKYASAAYNHKHVPVIAGILLDAAEKMSATPYFDGKEARIAGFSPKEGIPGLRRTIESAPTHSVDSMQEFLWNVYGDEVNFSDLCDVYQYFADTCLDYLEGWTYIDKKGSSKNKDNTRNYSPPKVDGCVAAALIARDV